MRLIQLKDCFSLFTSILRAIDDRPLKLILFAFVVGQKKINVKALHDTIHMLDSLSVDNGGTVEFGGWWKPNHCKPRATVCILCSFPVYVILIMLSISVFFMPLSGL